MRHFATRQPRREPRDHRRRYSRLTGMRQPLYPRLRSPLFGGAACPSAGYISSACPLGDLAPAMRRPGSLRPHSRHMPAHSLSYAGAAECLGWWRRSMPPPPARAKYVSAAALGRSSVASGAPPCLSPSPLPAIVLAPSAPLALGRVR